MNEDEKLNAFVKAALEEGVAVSPKRLAALEACAAKVVGERGKRGVSRLLPAMAWLVAAAFVVVLAFPVIMMNPKPSAVVSDEPVTSVIALFLEAEGAELDDIALASPAEALMAWQEAPCEEVL